MYRGIIKFFYLRNYSLRKLPKNYLIKDNFDWKKCICNFYFTSEIREKNSKKDLPYTMVSKYEPFSDESISEIFDVEKEKSEVKEEIFYDEFEGINFQRGTSGVFEIEEVINILKKEKAEDIIVVKIPPDYRYANYMVIVTGKSTRHMLTMIEFLRRVYKKKKNSTDLIPRIEGEDSVDWKALDLGNIIVHVFSKQSRNYYDIETLWAVGKEYDNLSQKKNENVALDYSKILEDLAPNKIAN